MRSRIKPPAQRTAYDKPARISGRSTLPTIRNLLFVIPWLFAQSVEGQEDLHVIKLKELSINLIWEDPQPAAEMKSIIAKDINLVVGHLVAIDVHPAPEEKNIRVNGKDILVEWMADFRGEGRYTPDDFYPHLFFGYGKEGNRHLIVGSPLIERYHHALEREKMRELLSHTMEVLRNGNATAGWVKEHLWFHSNVPKDFREDAIKQILEYMNKSRPKWREPSMLDIHQVPENDGEDLELQGRWVSKSYYFDDKGELKEAMPWIYDDGIWKIALAVPGT